jgi:tetratricopeptide (TPR) repeat protein
MVSKEKLDASCRPGAGHLIALLLLVLIAGPQAFAQENPSEAARISAVQKAFDAGKWEEAARLAQGLTEQSAELDLFEGLALAKLQRWEEARHAFEAGRRKAPGDSRFLVELAGVSYKQHNFQHAKRNLRAALRSDPHDAYTLNFLGSIYFLEGNLEAALKYWNRIDKPRLRSVAVQPEPRLDRTLLDRAVGFNAPQVLTGEALLAAEARLDALGIYPQQRLELVPAQSENYDATIHLVERNGWGDSKLEGAIALFSGIPYATVYPEFYNLGHHAVNVTSLLRWDSEKRRAFASLSAPLFHDPAMRLQTYFDAGNENWNLTNTFFGAGVPLSDLNLRRFAAGAQFRHIVNGRWNWSTGMEVAHRSFRNLVPTSAAATPFFADGTSFASWLRTDASILRIPERRFTLDGSAEARLGRAFANGLGPFGTVRGSLQAHWLPRAKGDDYDMAVQLRAGDTQGHVPFDELFQLGIERDNDLWLRGHAGTFHGRKGAAPLGRRYFLANWEIDKNVYSNGLFRVKLGPFLDNGAIADPSGLVGSQRWLWDAGAQCKIRLLGGVTVVLTYGRDLRGGRNVFYATTVR